MATLTWQDVAGQIRAPDNSAAAAMITQGLQQVANAAQAPERQRQERLDKEMKGLLVQSEMNAQTGNMIDRLDTKQKTEVKEKDMKEFGKNQSYLESGARKAAMAGLSLDEYLANDKVYQGMGEGARSYSAANLSDAYMRGDETRITMTERAADNAYRAQRDKVQERQFNMNYQLSKENAAMARQDRRDAAEERRVQREIANYGKPKVWKTGDDKTDKTMTILGQRTGAQWNEASGEAYAEKELADLGKGYANLGAVTNVFDSVNKQRTANGQRPLPLNVLKRVVDTGIGANSFINGFNDVDDTAIKQALGAVGEQYDLAAKGRDFYDQLSARVDTGAKTDEARVTEAWNSMFPKRVPHPAAEQSGLAPGYSMMDAYNIGGK